MIEFIREGLRAWRVDARAWLKAHGYEVWLVTGIWAVLSLLIFWLATGHESPRRYQDEFLFWGVAKTFAAHLGLTWRGADIGMRSWLYPVLLAPAFWIGGSVASEYTLVHLLNSLMMVGTVFPAFLMARMYLGRWPAVLAALMAVSVPAMNYAGVIGTENLAYLTATATFGAILLATARPRLRNWNLAFAAIVVAALTRTQFAIFLPIYLGTILLAGLMRERGTRAAFFRSQRAPVIAIGGLFALVGLAFLVEGRAVVGLYSGVFEGVPLTWSNVWFWTKAFAADIYLMTAVIPVVATLAMFLHKENRRDPLVGALLALALLSSLAFLAQVTWFSATNPYQWRTRHIFYERYMFYLGPLFFTGFFAAWRRVSVGSAILSAVFGFFIVSGFQTDAVLVPFSYDSFGLTLIGFYMDAHNNAVPIIGTLLARVTLLLGMVYVVATVPREQIARIGMLASTVLAFALLAYGQARTWYYARLYSHDAFANYARPANFVDKNTKQNVGMIVTSTDTPEIYFQTEFWNDRIVRAFATDAKPIESPLMYSPKCAFDWAPGGAILGTGCDLVPSAWYIRSDTLSLHLRDEIKRVHPQPQYPNITLIVAKPPPRLLSMVSDRNVFNGVMPGVMSVWTFLPADGELRVRFGKSEKAHVIKVGKDETVVPARSRASITVPVSASERLTEVTVNTTTGVPDSAAVTTLDVRWPGSGWHSIL